MDNFNTDNQDESNMVGKVVDKAVNVEQERLALIDEVRELQADRALVGEAFRRYRDSTSVIMQKAKAWDDLEALLFECRDKEVTLTKFVISDDGACDFFSIKSPFGGGYFDKTGRDLMRLASESLESIRGES